jgi:hypothetical protein
VGRNLFLRTARHTQKSSLDSPQFEGYPSIFAIDCPDIRRVPFVVRSAVTIKILVASTHKFFLTDQAIVAGIIQLENDDRLWRLCKWARTLGRRYVGNPDTDGSLAGRFTFAQHEISKSGEAFAMNLPPNLMLCFKWWLPLVSGGLTTTYLIHNDYEKPKKTDETHGLSLLFSAFP